MPKWYDTLKQQRQSGRDSITAVEGIDAIPEDASPDQGWSLPLTIKKITPRLTVDGQTYYWLLVKDEMEYAFSIVVWDHQWDDLGPFEEGEKRELTVRVPKKDYTAWNLF
jgi:hypothetical protein